MLTQLAATAELESGLISERTKAALAAYKARGGVLGSPQNLSDRSMAKGRKLGVAAVKALADEAYADLAPVVAELRSEGLSLRQIAERLNADGHTTRHGKPWNQVQVKRVLAGLEPDPCPPGTTCGRDRRERQAAGIAVAKERGLYRGRPRGTTKAPLRRAQELRGRGLTAQEIATALGVSRRTALQVPGHGTVVIP